MFPTKEQCSMLVWKLLVFLFIYLNLLVIFKKEALPPNGNWFHMMILFIAAHFAGQLSEVCQLPPLFGMLVAGFIHGNVTNANLDKTLTSSTRSIALIIILVRAGLNLDPQAIRRLSFVCARLAIIPSIVEAIIIALFASFVFELNISWSLLLGFVVGSVSPAVVVPGMVQLQEAGYGIEKGFPTLLIASASIDNVFAITAISICLGMVYAKGNSESWETALTILRGPAEAILGVVFGCVIGIILWYIPERYNREGAEKYELHRFILLASACVFAWFASQIYGFKSIGPLAIIAAPFISSIRWRENNLGIFCKESLKILWIVFENFLFCLIGSSVRIKDMKTDLIFSGVVCILAALTIRIFIAYLISFGNGFTWKERLFISIVWIPKATIQAAMGPAALDMATTDEDRIHGHLILTMAALSILLTAPVGAIAIDQSYKKLLDNDKKDLEDIPDDPIFSEEHL